MTRLAVVTSGFPRLSETFLLHELVALDAAGMLAAVFATKPGDGTDVQPGAERLLARVHHLAAGTPEQQGDEVVCLLDQRGEIVDGVHGYFAHVPAEVARRAARRLGVPFGFSVHARDVRKIESRELTSRVREAAVVVACNTDVECDVRDRGDSVVRVPHGVDLTRFAVVEPPAGPFTALAVGRLVEKKGFATLIDAVAELVACEIPVRLRIVGDGKLRDALERQVARHCLQDLVELPGATTHAALPGEFARAHVTVVPSIVDSTGDRDGLPNVVLEAMASGRPVIGTDAGAITSAVDDGTNGFIVPAGDVHALADGLRRLASDRALARRMGDAARATAVREFDLAVCTQRFVAVLEQSYG